MRVSEREFIYEPINVGTRVRNVGVPHNMDDDIGQETLCRYLLIREQRAVNIFLIVLHRHTQLLVLFTFSLLSLLFIYNA